MGVMLYTDLNKNALPILCIIYRQMRVANEVFAVSASLALVLVKETGHCLCCRIADQSEANACSLDQSEVRKYSPCHTCLG